MKTFLALLFISLVAFTSAEAATTISGTATSTFSGPVGVGTTTPAFGHILTVDGSSYISGSLSLGSALNTYDGYYAPNNTGLIINNYISNTNNDAQGGDGYGLITAPTIDTDTSSDGYSYGQYIGPGIIGSTPVYGLYGSYIFLNTGSHTGHIEFLYGTYSTALKYGTGADIDLSVGVLGEAGGGYQSGAGTIDAAYGVQGTVYNHGTSQISITTGAALHAYDYSSAGFVNKYGVLIDNVTGGTNKWNLYSVGATSRNFFGGSVGIGTSTQTTALHVTSPSTNATTTVTIGKVGQNKGTCLELFDSSGTVQYVSINAGVLVVRSTSCK